MTLCLGFLLMACQGKPEPLNPVEPVLTSDTHEQAQEEWTALSPISPPEGLRACCVFGYNIKAKLGGIPVPFYNIDNIVEAGKLGEHHYNDSVLGASAALLGVSDEKIGLLYTHKGGFVDISHVRDTADYTLFLFSQIYARLGQKWELTLDNELAARKIHFFAFTPPEDPAERYTLSVYLATKLAFKLAVWHEIAQWYGYQSVPGFPESVSAFSPEDLYSNLLGARLALTLILEGHASSVSQFSAAIAKILPTALSELGDYSRSGTKEMFDSVDGLWWNSYQRIPEKFLVLHRNYDIQDNRYPLMPSGKENFALRLALPEYYLHFSLDKLAEFQLWPTNAMKNLPAPKQYWTAEDFKMLVEKAQDEDARQLLIH
ncbi:DUF4056 domain-containing protein [Xenorhabdus nematophila]|uniref:DUF4056 domain-containing protein n=1 Tax=Xenorhabdus nematophila (strain ATCC 19061 / DSM 3370 / CCUG 14189 / LMG 1036 / NCIMB 9965 / AN6) TaxID=406817 RepID=D3VAY5_XENNA|nr:DUF4056 domain-containing protein [Xenorhabdus nematophila]CEE90518.1 conserved hypothetical protein [Xenorhabdus nematophila str. Anatoliense]CEF28694.1 conserved hypothetical protein [Xenorhabdus nematophila str. Websteri]AYA42367.1 DUF4056 domain-containing protein [Xenorhabdus nematophila]MBA0021101.1 DUF4056 domain-containing protein [Xenorhabdus nematophila]MCB4425211.1 DUF4056 domain-containing protein [Xenorhabdus nematophila]